MYYLSDRLIMEWGRLIMESGRLMVIQSAMADNGQKENGAFKTKCTESGCLPEVLSEWGCGDRCAEPEHEGRGRSAPSATSHMERINIIF